jgi:hypothetical protein
MTTMVFGVVFCFFTVVSSLRSLDCSFQTPARIEYTSTCHPRGSYNSTGGPEEMAWAGFLDSLRESSGSALYTGTRMVTRLVMISVAHVSRLLSTPRHKVRSLANDPEWPGILSSQALLGVYSMRWILLQNRRLPKIWI